VVGSIPNCGFIKNKGWVESLVLFKPITAGITKKRDHHHEKGRFSQVRANPTSAVSVIPPPTQNKHGRTIDDVSKHGRTTDDVSIPRCDDNFEMTNNSPSDVVMINGRPKLSYFPVSYTSAGGVKVVIDYVSESEITEVYKLYQDAASKGQGYGADEFDGLEGFRKSFAEEGHAFLARDVNTGAILFTFSITSTVYCRSSNPVMADSYMLISPNNRGKSIGLDMVRITLKVMRDLGYKGVVSDTFLSNQAMFRLMHKIGMNTVAYIPNGAKVQGIGWTDMVIMHRNLEENEQHFAKFDNTTSSRL